MCMFTKSYTEKNYPYGAKMEKKIKMYIRRMDKEFMGYLCNISLHNNKNEVHLHASMWENFTNIVMSAELGR